MMADTEYLVLEQHKTSTPEAPIALWAEVETTFARSARAAIRAVAKGEGVYVAVPTRSFKMEPVDLETQTKLKFK